jgi:hypothetical protein
MRRLPGKLHIGNELPLENLPDENQPLALTAVTQAVTHQRLMQGGGQLGSEIPDLVGVAENYQTWLLFLDNLPQRSRVAVRRIVGEQAGIDAQYFLELKGGKFGGKRRNLVPQKHRRNLPPKLLSELLPGGHCFPRGPAQLARLMLSENQNRFSHVRSLFASGSADLRF